MKSIEAMGSAAPGGSLSKPLMIALGALLVGKMMSGGSAQAAAPGNQQHRAEGAGSADGGLLGGLGGLLFMLSRMQAMATANSKLDRRLARNENRGRASSARLSVSRPSPMRRNRPT